MTISPDPALNHRLREYPPKDYCLRRAQEMKAFPRKHRLAEFGCWDQWNRKTHFNDAVTKSRNGESIPWAMPWTISGCQSRKITSYQLELTKLHPPYPQ